LSCGRHAGELEGDIWIRSSVRSVVLSIARVLITAALLASAAPVVAYAQTPAPASTQDTASPPALIVTVVIDQFSANLFNQYRSRFTGGMRTLIDQGLVYANGYQAQGITKTCPGHSTVLSGAFPTHTGIPSNEWIDPVTGKEVYCLAAPQNTLADGGEGENGRVGPNNLRVSLLPDWLKAQPSRARIVARSIWLDTRPTAPSGSRRASA
jgi:hypothetical protein